jgi:hypothetical protein
MKLLLGFLSGKLKQLAAECEKVGAATTGAAPSGEGGAASDANFHNDGNHLGNLS